MKIELDTKRAERELSELIAKTRALRIAITEMATLLGRDELIASGFDLAFVDTLLDLEKLAHKGLRKLRKRGPARP